MFTILAGIMDSAGSTGTDNYKKKELERCTRSGIDEFCCSSNQNQPQEQ